MILWARDIFKLRLLFCLWWSVTVVVESCLQRNFVLLFLFFNDSAIPGISSVSLLLALPIWSVVVAQWWLSGGSVGAGRWLVGVAVLCVYHVGWSLMDGKMVGVQGDAVQGTGWLWYYKRGIYSSLDFHSAVGDHLQWYWRNLRKGTLSYFLPQPQSNPYRVVHVRYFFWSSVKGVKRWWIICPDL